MNITTAKPIADGMTTISTIDLFIEKNGEREKLEFSPTVNNEIYSARMIPTQTGPYSVILTGQVVGRPVDVRTDIEDVESNCGLQFPRDPACEVTEEPSFPPPGQIDNRLEVMENELDVIDNQLGPIANKLDNVERSLTSLKGSITSQTKFQQDLQNLTVSSYVLGAIGVTTGIVGIAIGLIAIKKR